MDIPSGFWVRDVDFLRADTDNRAFTPNFIRMWDFMYCVYILTVFLVQAMYILGPGAFHGMVLQNNSSPLGDPGSGEKGKRAL